MSVRLDTAVLIAAERGTFDMPRYLAALGDAPVAHARCDIDVMITLE